MEPGAEEWRGGRSLGRVELRAAARYAAFPCGPSSHRIHHGERQREDRRGLYRQRRRRWDAAVLFFFKQKTAYELRACRIPDVGGDRAGRLGNHGGEVV